MDPGVRRDDQSSPSRHPRRTPGSTATPNTDAAGHTPARRRSRPRRASVFLQRGLGIELVRRGVGQAGGIVFDASKPDGTPRKRMEVSRLRQAGWVVWPPLAEGLRLAYAEFDVTAKR